MRVRDPRRAWRLSARAACLVGIVAVPSHAEPGQAVLWYRSAEGCPDAAEFLARLGDRASLARVAEAGDYVDFVVTLTATEQGSSGRLERQTQSGTVAIQEIRDRECARVADALALSLALALDPAAPLVHRASEPEPRVEAAQGPSAVLAERAVQTESLSPGSSGSRAVVVARSARAEPDQRSAEPPSRTLAWFVGAHGGLMTGVTPDEVAVRGDLFAEMATSEARAANGSESYSLGPDPSEGATLRLASIVSASSPEYERVGTVRHSMAGARADACWPSAGTTWIALRPCLALELGVMAAVRSWPVGVADTVFWAALGALGRGRAWVSHVIGVEAEFGLLVPLRRYIVESEQGTLYENRRVGFTAAVGPVLRLY